MSTFSIMRSLVPRGKYRGLIVAILALIYYWSSAAAPVGKNAVSTISPTQQSALGVSTESTQERTVGNPSEKIKALVLHVVDGDTVTVQIGSVKETIRLIGIDTPEVVDPRKPVQCFGKEASDKAKELLSGKTIFLQSDSSQGERDKYKRLLRYVFLEDGTNFNEYMIREGYAHEYTYQSNPYQYQNEFIRAQEDARKNKRGFWAEDVCN